MLVLSRRPKQKIIFPTLGVTLEVCSVKGNVVRIGLEAPPSIPIVREEIFPGAEGPETAEHKAARHQVRNRLQVANLAVHLAQKQAQDGLYEKAYGFQDSTAVLGPSVAGQGDEEQVVVGWCRARPPGNL
jgi:two-component system OmpR family response regulator